MVMIARMALALFVVAVLLGCEEPISFLSVSSQVVEQAWIEGFGGLKKGCFGYHRW